VWRRIWIHLDRAGISPAIQRQEIHLFKGVKERGEKTATDPLTLLKEIDIFRPFSEEAKSYLSRCIRSHHFAPNKEIVKQGQPGDSLFIIVEGVVGIRKNKGTDSVEVARLGAGNFFGEMALLTGEERGATVVSLTETYLFEITKEDIASLMAAQPEVSELIIKILKEREKATSSRMNEKSKDTNQGHTDQVSLLKRIEKFFSLGKS
jgi:branched-chain amino acid transport system substrate-binding protein